MSTRSNRSTLLRLSSTLFLLATLAMADDADVLEQARNLRVEDPQAALALLDRHIGKPAEFASSDFSPEQARNQARLLELRARILRDIGRRADAAADAARFERFAEALEDPVRQARAQYLRGTIEAERGDIAGALERFHGARQTLEATDATAELAR